MGRVFATADIGSNTVHLLIAEESMGKLQRLSNESDWQSLGLIVSREGHIPEPAATRLITTLNGFKAAVQLANAEGFYVFATEAMRIASNHDAVLERIRIDAGLQVELISGRREAELSLRGALMDTEPAMPCLLAEVGGGSAQIALCTDNGIENEVSLPLGTGPLIASFGLLNPTTKAQQATLEHDIYNELAAIGDFGPVRSAIASGGVARGLLRSLHPDGEQTLHLREIEFLAWTAARSTVEQLAARFHVKSKRASTLYPGACVYAAILRSVGLEEMSVSEFGVREGAIIEMATGGSAHAEVKANP